MSPFNLVHHTHRGNAATEDHTPYPTTYPDPPTPKFTALAPLGTLSVLSRELRDHIYSHVCNQGFPYSSVNHPRYALRHYGLRGTRQNGMQCDHPTLRVCKAIREEFLAFLCSKSFFLINHLKFRCETQRSDIPFLNEISKIKIVVDLEYMSDDFKSRLLEVPPQSSRYDLLSSIKAEPVSFFTGTSVMRKVCVLDFFDCMPTSLLTLLSSPLMHAMCQLTGFTTVRLDFSTYAHYWLKRETPQHVRQTFHSLGTCPGFDTMVLRVISALEPFLGSFARSRLNKEKPWTQRVTFHPQDHLNKEVEELGAKSSTEMEKEMLDFPFMNWTKDYHQ